MYVRWGVRREIAEECERVELGTVVRDGK